MKKIITMMAILFLHSVAVANEGTVIRMSKVAKVGNVVVEPSAEYDIDFSNYEIPKEAKLVIFHVLDSPRSHYYYQEIRPGKSVYKMNSNTLKATAGSPPFKGLKNSDGVFLIVGSETQQGSINMGILYSNESIAVIVRSQ